MTGGEYVRTVSSAVFDPLRGKAPLLRAIDIELTERCNNRCIHCYINRPANDPEAEAREMKTEFVIDLLGQAADQGCLSVRFTGGEPLLRPDFAELYMAARRKGMQVTLFTNARLVTPELATLLSNYPPGHPVEVSVYGLRPGSYDAVAGVRGGFEEFRRGLDLLLEHGVPVVVKGVFLSTTRDELGEFETWSSGIPGMNEPPGMVLNYDLRARRDDPGKNRRIRDLRLTAGAIVDELSRDPGLREETRMFLRRQPEHASDRLFTCGAGLGISVDSYGFAQMCLLLRHPDTVVDLRQHSLEEVLTELFPAIREMRSEDPLYLQRCAGCFIHSLCDQCPAKSWMEHGTLDTPVDYLCEIAHARARHLGLLGASERAWDVPDGRERVLRFLSSKTISNED